MPRVSSQAAGLRRQWCGLALAATFVTVILVDVGGQERPGPGSPVPGRTLDAVARPGRSGRAPTAGDDRGVSGRRYVLVLRRDGDVVGTCSDEVTVTTCGRLFASRSRPLAGGRSRRRPAFQVELLTLEAWARRCPSRPASHPAPSCRRR